MSILLYGINVMSSVLEEKTTKIVEVLISSLRPFQLLMGKVRRRRGVDFPVPDLGCVTRLLHLSNGAASSDGLAEAVARSSRCRTSRAAPPPSSLRTSSADLLYFAMFAAVGRCRRMNRKPPGSTARDDAAGCLLHQHVCHVERSGVDPVGDALDDSVSVRPIAMPSGGRRDTTVSEVGCARDPGGIDTGSDVDRVEDLQGSEF